MLSSAGLANLRRAATLNHQFPTLCTRLSVEGRVVLEVAWPPSETCADALMIQPCAFRMRVAQAWRHWRDGRKLQFLDLKTDPVIDLVPVIGGCQWPSGVIRVPAFGRYSYLITSTLGPDQCRRHAAPHVEQIGEIDSVIGIGFKGDPDTQVTVIRVDTDASKGFVNEDVLVDQLEQMTSVLAAAELLSELAIADSP